MKPKIVSCNKLPGHADAAGSLTAVLPRGHCGSLKRSLPNSRVSRANAIALAWVRRTLLGSAIPNGSGHESAKPPLAFSKCFL